MSDGGAEEEDGPEVKTCSFYLEGRCRFGVRCRNLHPPDDREIVQSAKNPPAGAERAPAGAERAPAGAERAPAGAERAPAGAERAPAGTAGAERAPAGTAGAERAPTRTAGAERAPTRTAGTKKPPMRTAGAVVSRLQWDTGLRADLFTVGYLDRFVGLVEQPFAAFSWGDLASAEQGVLAVPEHRIQYFKYQQRVVWDKRSRLDLIFGSTGDRCIVLGGLDTGEGPGDITDISVTGDNTHHDVNNDDINVVSGDDIIAEAHEVSGDDIITEAHEVSGDDIITETHEVSGDEIITEADEVSGDDIITEAHEVSGDDIITEAHEVSGDDIIAVAHDDEACSSKWSLGLSPSLTPSPRPNHFVAVRICSEEFKMAAKEVQEYLARALPDFGGCCVPLSRLHLTLCPLSLDSPAQVESARSALRLFGLESRRPLPPPLLLSFGGLRDFGGRVLYAAPQDSLLPELSRLAGELESRFRDRGLCVLGSQSPRSTPFHVTIAKLPRNYCRQWPEIRLVPELYQQWPETLFGCQILDTLSLCVTRGGGGTEGFYSTALVVCLY